jgi:hypothetical protein
MPVRSDHSVQHIQSYSDDDVYGIILYHACMHADELDYIASHPARSTQIHPVIISTLVKLFGWKS